MFKKVFGFFLLSVLSLSLLSAWEISTKGWFDSYVVPTVRLNAADGDLEVTAPEKFPVNYGGMVTFEVSGSGSGAMEMVLLVYDKDGNHIHTFSRQRGIPRNNAAISMKLRVDGGWKGAAPAYGAVALRLAKGASMEVTGTKITYEDKPAVAATTRALRRPETGAQNVDKILTREAARVRNPHVLFLGDSITANWTHDQKHRWPGGGEAWEKTFAPMNAVNFGVSGDHIENVLWRITAGKQLICKPKNIVILIGTNNLWESTAEEVVNGMDNLLNVIKQESPESRIHLLAILPRKGDYPIAYINSRLKKIAEGRADFHDFSALMQPSLDDPAKGLYREDGLHLTLKGYEVLGDAVKKILPQQQFEKIDTGSDFVIHQVHQGNTIGDAYIFVAPDGKVTLIDGGDSPQYATRLRPALDRLNIRHIHQIIITHMHWDHYGASRELLVDNDITVDKILWQTKYDWEYIKKDEPRSYNAYRIHISDLRKKAKARNIPFIELANSGTLDFGSGAKGEILYGCNDIRANYINNQSLVFRFTYGDTSMLFTGDMGYEEEAALLATGANVKCDILKAAHHSGGGSNGVNFIRAVNPDFAVAPQPDFLYTKSPGIDSAKRFAEAGVKIFYSHEFPQLRLQTDGKKFTVWEGNRQLTVKDITK